MDELRRVAAQAGVSPARMALSWVMGRPGVGTALIGVSRLPQLADCVAALDFSMAPVHRASLDAISAPADPRMLYALARPPMRRQVVFGGASVAAWPPGA